MFSPTPGRQLQPAGTHPCTAALHNQLPEEPGQLQTVQVTAEMPFHHLKGLGYREPQLVRVQQNQRGGGSGLLLWEEQGKDGKVVRCANKVFMYNTPRAIPFSAWQLCPILEIISSPWWE